MPTYNPYAPQPQGALSTEGGFYTVLINGESGAISYPVASGNTVLLMDFNSNKFWLKSTNVNGIPQQLRSFSFKEETPEIQNGNVGVTRAEFTELSQNVTALAQNVSELIKELKGDSNE